MNTEEIRSLIDQVIEKYLDSIKFRDIYDPYSAILSSTSELVDSLLYTVIEINKKHLREHLLGELSNVKQRKISTEQKSQYRKVVRQIAKNLGLELAKK